MIGNRNTSSIINNTKDNLLAGKIDDFNDKQPFLCDLDYVCFVNLNNALNVFFQETGEIALTDLSRDLNKWIITIPSIESRRELISS